MQRYNWHELKRVANLEKHGLDFRHAWEIFEGAHIDVKSELPSIERRRVAVGLFRGEFFVTVVYTLRDDVTWIISMRRARRDERQAYARLHGG